MSDGTDIHPTEHAKEHVTASWRQGAARWSILVHGGAGDVPADKRALHVAGCERAAAAGAEVLARGGSAVDAVEVAVRMLEDDPIFNAGTGACLDADGKLSLDAAIMDGASLEAGAVCAMRAFTNPIAIARRVMIASPHVLLAAEGAARFAVDQGFAPADEEAMITEAARARLEAVRANKADAGWAGGTVGAVARDAAEHVAAATSTGGMVAKHQGRVGDSPILGAGTYADDEAGACSTTGHGEAMLRLCTAKSVVDAMGGMGRGGETCTPEIAARIAVDALGRRTNGTGGVIAVGRDGSLGLARSTRTMSWAAVFDGGSDSGS